MHTVLITAELRAFVRSLAAPLFRPLQVAAILSLLVFALGSAPVHAGVKAGKVIMAKGSVEAVSGEARRQLKRRSVIHAGELVSTGKDSRAQIRFVDGALLTLDQDSELAIDEYSYQNEAGKPDQVLMRLVKGGLRTVTGAIGKSNKQAYQLETPLATIGIRGTMYSVTLRKNGSLLEVVVDQGAVEVLNEFGSTRIGVGQPHRFARVQPGFAPEGGDMSANPDRGAATDFGSPPDFVSTEPEQNPEYLDQLDSLERQDSTADGTAADGTATGGAAADGTAPDTGSAPPQEI